MPHGGVRITPNYSDKPGGALMFTIPANGSQPALIFTDGATPSRGWTFEGLYLTGDTNKNGNGMIYMGPYFTATHTDNTTLPSDITFSHCIIRPNPTTDRTRRMISAHANNVVIKDSWLWGGWVSDDGQDGQAVSMNGGGLVTIDNSYLDGQTETVGIGGFGYPSCYTPTGYPINLITTGCLSALRVTNSQFEHGLWKSLNWSWPTTSGSKVRFAQFYQAPNGWYYQAQTYGVTSATNPNVISWPTSVGITVTDGTVTWKAVNSPGSSPAVAKNHIECKQCNAITVDGSYFHNAWSQGPGAQGYAWTLYTRTNQGPGFSAGPFTLRNNIVDSTASAFQIGGSTDDADINSYPVLIASSPGPYVISAGVNDGITINGTTWTIPAGTYSAAQLADNINSHFNALGELSVTVTALVDAGFGWHDVEFQTSGTQHFNAWIGNYAGSPVRFKGFTGSWAWLNDQLWYGAAQRGPDATWAWDDTHFNVRLLAPSQPVLNLPATGTATVATGPIVAGTFPDPTNTNVYLALGNIGPMPTTGHISPSGGGGIGVDKSSYIQVSGTALSTIGIEADKYAGCTHPITHQFYACGHPLGATIVNNLFQHIAQPNNYLSVGAMYVQGNIPLQLEHNTIDYVKNAGVYFALPYNPGTVRSNVFYNPSKVDRYNLGVGYISFGNVGDMDAANYALCSGALNKAQYLAWGAWPANACSQALSGNVFTGAWQAHILPGESGFGSDIGNPYSNGTFPHSTMAPFASQMGFYPGTWKLAPAGYPMPPASSVSIYTNITSGYHADSNPVNLGVVFNSDVSGQVTALKYYQDPGCPLTAKVGSLWTGTGALLAQKAFAAPSGGGWQTITLDTPISITAGATYVASYLTNDCLQTGGTGAAGNGPVHATGQQYLYSSASAFPNTPGGGGNAYLADIVFSSNGSVPLTSGLGSDMKGWRDYADVGVDTTKLPLINGLQVAYSDRAAIISWLDSEASQNIPGVLRLCTQDPDYNPYCTPVGSITSVDPATGALADNSDNDSSPKTGLQRYIVVTGLAANTQYYGQLYRGGHYRQFSFMTMAALSGSVSVPVSRSATAKMGSIANMATSYGAAYSRLSGMVTGGTASKPCSAGSVCSVTVAAPAGVPLYLQCQMQDDAGARLYSYPVSIMIPGGATAIP
jgi:hypothetical protein